MSLNGIVAKSNGDTPWSEDIWKNYYSMAKKYSAIILGRKTYELMKEVNEFEKIGNPFTIVVTSQKINEQNTVSALTPKDAIKILKEKNFNSVLVGGGTILNTSFMEQNLIDEIYLDIEPIIIAEGIPLFNDKNFETKLLFKDQKKIGENTIQLHYSVIK